MNKMFVTDNLLAITAVYRHGCRYLRITVHGNLLFVDTVLFQIPILTAVLFPILDYCIHNRQLTTGTISNLFFQI